MLTHLGRWRNGTLTSGQNPGQEVKRDFALKGAVHVS